MILVNVSNYEERCVYPLVIDPKMEKAINGQIRAELESAYLYLSMASWFDANDLGGCAHWMKKQFEEEKEQATKLHE